MFTMFYYVSQIQQEVRNVLDVLLSREMKYKLTEWGIFKSMFPNVHVIVPLADLRLTHTGKHTEKLHTNYKHTYKLHTNTQTTHNVHLPPVGRLLPTRDEPDGADPDWRFSCLGGEEGGASGPDVRDMFAQLQRLLHEESGRCSVKAGGVKEWCRCWRRSWTPQTWSSPAAKLTWL